MNVMLFPGVPTVAELANLGVRRISVGPAFILAAFGAVVDAATELREQCTYSWTEGALRGMAAALPAFG